MPGLSGRKEEKLRVDADKEWIGETCLRKKRLQDHLYSNVSRRDVCCHLSRKDRKRMIARLLFFPAWKDTTHEQGVSHNIRAQYD